MMFALWPYIMSIESSVSKTKTGAKSITKAPAKMK